MDIIIGILATTSAFFAMLLLGVPISNAIARRRGWRPRAPVDLKKVLASAVSEAAFVPLEMEPFQLGWPSEAVRKSTALPEPPWPSETWDDEVFGTQARADLQKMKDSIDATEARAARGMRNLRKHQEPVHRQKRQVSNTAQAVHDASSSSGRRDRDAARRQREEALRQARQEAKDRARRQAEARARAQREAREREQREARERAQRGARKQPRRQAPAPPKPVGGGFREPSPAEVAEMVRELGLAGAVEKIRGETGWEFRRAAQYLASVLRENQ